MTEALGLEGVLRVPDLVVPVDPVGDITERELFVSGEALFAGDAVRGGFGGKDGRREVVDGVAVAVVVGLINIPDFAEPGAAVFVTGALIVVVEAGFDAVAFVELIDFRTADGATGLVVEDELAAFDTTEAEGLAVPAPGILLCTITIVSVLLVFFLDKDTRHHVKLTLRTSVEPTEGLPAFTGDDLVETGAFFTVLSSSSAGWAGLLALVSSPASWEGPGAPTVSELFTPPSS